MSRPRILYILSSLAANDLGDEIVTVLGHLSRARFDPAVVVLGGKEDLKSRLEDLEVHQYFLGLAGALGAWRAIGRVRRVIASAAPEVVHGFGSWAGAVAQLAAPKDVAVVRSVTRPPNHEKDLRGRVLRWLERRARSRVSTWFIVPNEGSRGLAVRAYGAADGHVVVLPRSIDVGEVRDRVGRTNRHEARTLFGLGPDDPAVALITDFESESRMDEILDGFALAVREHPRLRLFVVGSGRHEGSTRWKAEELALGDSVMFFGRGTEVWPIWAAADLAIDATPWASWSRTALVAITAGLPTLKRQEALGGWSEELEEELPVISGAPERFATEVLRLANDPVLRAEVARHSAGVVQAVDASRVSETLGELYRSLA
jgi:glycosyltransferase involved in cell wall biosynthesis